MDEQQHMNRSGAGFPVDRPLEALKADHATVKQLFERFLNTQDMNVRQEAGPRVIELLEMHAALEETVFYPQVHDVDPSLVNHSEQEHQEARDLMQQLKGMDVGDPQYEQLMRQLSESVLHHVESEEQQLFPKVQQANLDMTALGVQMQAYEASMVSAAARASDQPGRPR
ncbi:MAG TPA: hemerythrin domain-containing protein [Noviherbaspirillum sp.]|jgi:hemerythrin superfamily protein|uniref:hemerythrin domain-containing protein n=1 Tax=Noviherbaspirillum sp. TaxID=1926288 RepID=UPI002F959413